MRYLNSRNEIIPLDDVIKVNRRDSQTYIEMYNTRDYLECFEQGNQTWLANMFIKWLVEGFERNMPILKWDDFYKNYIQDSEQSR